MAAGITGRFRGHRRCVGTVNLSNSRAIFARSPARLTRSRVTYEAYVVSRTSRRPQVDSALTVTFVISSACVDVMHKSCVQECPVDCIYEGARALYINPDECVDCGACKLACEAGAIYYETDVPEDEQQHLADNAGVDP
jgi:NAD-dependent dihydropyrimidine dehydrogenase PreA subunit